MANKSRPRSTLLALSLLAAAAAPCAGQTAAPDPLGDLARTSHVVIPQSRSFAMAGPMATPGIDIESVDARVRIVERTARTRLEISLRNTSGAPQEAALLLPVPDGAVVSGFTFDGDAAHARAEVLPADEARRLYDAIVAKLLDPALLEFAGYNLVRTSVFPVPPGAGQKVRLTYEHLLEGDANRVDYVLPRTEALDARRPWRITVDVESEHAISTVYSPSHALVEERAGAGRVTARLDESARLDPGSFRLSYLVDRGPVSASLFAYPDPEVGGGYFLLMAGLPAEVGKDAPRVRREVTLVIDRSGSMAGAKMDQARAAALQIVEGLDDGEAFNIIDYSTTVASFAPRPVVKDRKTILQARAYVASIRPAGGTNIHEALTRALAQEPVDAMLPIVLFLTDGLPTIGRTSEVDIRDLVERENAHGRRVFTFGVGEDVNAPLLDRVADLTRGAATYVLPDEDVELKVAQVFKRLYGPVFAEPALRTTDTSGAEQTRLVSELIPQALPDLFEGDQLILLGQYRADEPVTFVFTGDYLGERREFRFTFNFDDATTRNAFVPRLWASRRIAFLIDEIRQAGAEAALRPRVPGAPVLADPRHQEIVDEILRLSTKFGILTEYTAFLAREGTDLADWERLVAGCSANLDERAVRTRSGQGALNQAFNYRRQKGQVALNPANAYLNERLEWVGITDVQQVCDRAFFRRGGQWVDSRLLDGFDRTEPERVIVIGSPEHTALLRRMVLEGRQGVLSLRGSILLEVDGRAVLLKDGC